MYPFERFLKTLKDKVGNKARVEASTCEAYLTEEATITTKKGQIYDRRNGRSWIFFWSENRPPTDFATKIFGRKKPRRNSKSDQTILVGDNSDRITVAEWSQLWSIFRLRLRPHSVGESISDRRARYFRRSTTKTTERAQSFSDHSQTEIRSEKPLRPTCTLIRS